MSLKALEVKAFLPSEKPYKKADELGLYLEVFPIGSKFWRFKYRFSGKEKRLALGAYPDVSLAEARELRDAARKKVRAGIDPALERKLGKIAAKVSAGNSFQLVAEEYIAVKLVQSGRAEATITKSRWLLAHLVPAIWAAKIIAKRGGAYAAGTTECQKIRCSEHPERYPDAYRAALAFKVHYMLKCAPAAVESKLEMTARGPKPWGQSCPVYGKRLAVWQGWEKCCDEGRDWLY